MSKTSVPKRHTARKPGKVSPTAKPDGRSPGATAAPPPAEATPALAATPRKRRKDPPGLSSLAFDIRADVGQVRAIAYTLNDIEFQGYSASSKDHLEWLKYVLLESLQEKCNVLARLTKQLEAHPAARPTS